MDKGAHFYRCDFQVHSPRDKAWTGRKFGVAANDILALTPQMREQITLERTQFAKEYLDKARSAGLNAIAITDHHDIHSLKLIRKVAEEQNEDFKAKSQYEKVLTVFPGIELTLSNPVCQCILLFDADFPDAHLDSVIAFLGINATHEFETSTVETQRISQQIINDLVHLHNKLDELTYCRGRYIVLPNVGDGGQHSILRQGFHEHYRKMPCVGGYVDKEISNAAGYQNKISGGDIHYGNKSIALISTSDNRYEDGRHFGRHATWIKWAEPTAEALRQACLAKESRISQVEPELPQIFIRSIDVTNSKFLGAFDISFNRQYNAFIGGRGTGKSTILEYLRFGLCDQSSSNSIDYEEMSLIEKRRAALIQKTLKDVSGEVRITMERNGVVHIVKRNAKTNEVLLKIGEGEFQQVKEDDIRKLLPIQSYSQKQLSDVGVKTDELKRFIEQPIMSRLDALKFQLGETGIKLKSSYNQLTRKKEVEQEIENYGLELQSLTTQIETIRKSLKGISNADQEIIQKKSLYETEQIIINNSKNELTVFENKADELQKLLELYPEKIDENTPLENKGLIQNISSEVDKKFVEIRAAAKTLKSVFSQESLSEFNSLINEWNIKKEAFEIAYNQAKSNSQSSQQQLLEIKKIETRITEINKLVSERKALLKEIGAPEIDYEAQKQNWARLHSEKVELLNTQAKHFTALSKNLIKAEVTKSINLSPFKTQFKNISEGTRIREDRIDAIVDHIKHSQNPIDEYTQVVNELRLLAELKISEDKSLKIPDTPILSNCGYTEEHKHKLTNKLNSDNWLLLSAVELEFNPEFYYTTNNELGDVIPFGAASAGQQATALLTVLLNQPGMPLIIDQPEDDIDNRAIDQIIANIWDAKKRRQLIFTSHNANLVVNGDAELVIGCDYRDSNSQTRGIIKVVGAIDTKDVKNEIISVMEGGEKAFRLRKEKFGY